MSQLLQVEEPPEDLQRATVQLLQHSQVRLTGYQQDNYQADPLPASLTERITDLPPPRFGHWKIASMRTKAVL